MDEFQLMSEIEQSLKKISELNVIEKARSLSSEYVIFLTKIFSYFTIIKSKLENIRTTLASKNKDEVLTELAYFKRCLYLNFFSELIDYAELSSRASLRKKLNEIIDLQVSCGDIVADCEKKLKSK